jgi:nucleoid-associated protein YgaU
VIGLFLDNSRYFNVKTVAAKTDNGKEVQAVTLRRLPYVAGTPTIVKGGDRLDVIAQRRYSDPTKFWHIADANTELDANDRIKQHPEDVLTPVINVPET